VLEAQGNPGLMSPTNPASEIFLQISQGPQNVPSGIGEDSDESSNDQSLVPWIRGDLRSCRGAETIAKNSVSALKLTIDARNIDIPSWLDPDFLYRISHSPRR